MYETEQIQSKVINIADTLPVSKVILVGSYARNEATAESDIDLVIEGIDLSESYWEFLFQLEDAFSVKIHLMTMRGLQNSCIRNNVLERGIVLYEK